MPLQCGKVTMMEIVRYLTVRSKEKYAWKLGAVSHQEGMASAVLRQRQSSLSLQFVRSMTLDVMFHCNSSLVP